MKSNTLTFTRYFKIALGFLALIFCILIITACTDPKFTITFDTGLGSNIDPITNYQNTTIQNPGTPTKDGYDFIGWQLDGQAVTFPLTLTRNKTLVAIWEQIIIPDPIRHTITFDTGLGSNIDPITDYRYTTIQAPTNPIRVGYDFIGWRLDGVLVTFPLELLSDKTLTAGWARIIIPTVYVSVTLDPNGGTLTSEAVLTTPINTRAGEPTPPTRFGYTFLGWFDGEEEFGFLNLIRADMTLQARWQEGTEGLQFSVTGQEITVIGYVGSDLHVIVPSAVNGIPVRTIGHQAFYNSSITSITLPQGLQTIELNAFANSNITEIIMPSTVTNIKGGAFSGITTLTSIVLNDGLRTIGSAAFNETSITNVVIPSTVTSIDSGAFANITTLTCVTLNEGLQTIGFGAFRNSNLTEIIIPSTVAEISLQAFSQINGLHVILADESTTTHVWWETSIASIYLPATITTIAENAFRGLTTIANVSLNDGLISIGSNAFENSSITEIVIPSSVTNIGAFAFSGSASLVSVELNEGLQFIGWAAFANTSISEILIPSTVTHIEASAFANTNLTEVVIPSSIRTIRNNIFAGVTSLTTVILNKGLQTIEGGAFANTGVTDIVIPSTVTSINGFENSALASIYLPHGLQIIGSGAFRGTNLTDIIIPSTVTHINGHAFYEATHLSDVVLNVGLQSIGNAAFAHTSITEIIIPSSVTNLGQSAFRRIATLTSVTIEGSINAINNWTFEDTSITEVIIPSSVTRIGTQAFANTNLIDVIIPSSVTDIGTSAFSGIATLTNLTLNDGLQFIGTGAFENTGIYELIIPTTVRRIGDGAFINANITELYIPSSVLWIGTLAFAQNTTLNELILNEGLQSIGMGAFVDTNITEVTIPLTVEFLGRYAFPYSTNINLATPPPPIPVACGESIVISKLFTSSIGTRNNAVELFNISNDYVDLSVYTLRIFDNAWSSFGTNIFLTGIVAPNSFFTVIGPNHTINSVISVADFIHHSNLNFSGSSPVALIYEFQTVDIVGYRWQDSDNFSNNSTLIRMNQSNFWQQSPTFNTFNFIRYAPDVWQYLENFNYAIYSLEQILRGPRLEDRVHTLPFRNPNNLSRGGGGVMQANLSRVVDGDTSHFFPLNPALVSGLPLVNITNATAVRYYGLEAPEVSATATTDPEQWGIVAGFFNRNFIHHSPNQQTIFIQSIPGETILDGTGNRILGLVWVDGQLSHFSLLLNGLGEISDRRSNFDATNVAMTYRNIPLLTFKIFAQNEAKSLQLGIWSDQIAPDWNPVTDSRDGSRTTANFGTFIFPNSTTWQPHFPIEWE